MHRQSGIALVTSLFILVAVMLIGLGSIFLTRTNIKVSENIRSNAVARNNADSGVEAVFLLLSNYHDTYGTFPSSQSSIELPNGSGYTLSSYRFDSADQAMVRIRGSSLQGAEHEAELLLNLITPEPEIPEVYRLGLVSEGKVTVTSNATLMTDVGIHGNAGFDIGGTLYECTARNAAGDCTANVEVDASSLPLYLSDPTGTCKFGGGPACDPADYLADPMTVAPNYVVRRDAAMAAADLDGDEDWDADDCALAASTISPAMTDQVVCSDENLKVDNPLWSNVTIITEGKIELEGTAFLTNVTLISLDDEVKIESGTMQDTHIYSDHDLDFKGNPANYVWNDANTIATAGHIEFNGSGKNSNTVNPPTNADGTKEIGMVLIAEDDITLNGSSSTNQDYYAIFVTGKKFEQNGTSTIFGTISSRDDIKINGNFVMDAGYQIETVSLEEEPDPEVRVISRR